MSAGDGPQSAMELCLDALEHDLASRPAWLARACASNPTLRAEVQRLLDLDHEAQGFLSESPIRAATPPPPVPDSNPNTLSLPSDIAAPPRFQSGQVLAQRFHIVRFIDRGGMGEVYEAADSELENTRIALKVIRPEIAADANAIRRFRQEIITAHRLTHPNLCPVYALYPCAEPAPAFLVITMRLLRGETLRATLASQGALPAELAHQVTRQLVQGIAAIHEAGIIHRDLKPNNIMLEHANGRLCVYIMDFGLARLHESEATLLAPGLVPGTAGYIAPELLDGHPPSRASDLFALGVILHQVFTGQRPQPARDGRGVEPSPDLDTLPAARPSAAAVRGLLSRQPELRLPAFDLLHAPPASTTRLLPITRRGLLIGASATAAVAATSAWLGRESLYDALHPLPARRFVAALTWPPPADPSVRPAVSGLVDAIATELARAEVYDRSFCVTTQLHSADMTTPAQVDQVRESLGANLVLAATAATAGSGLRVTLQVLDAASGLRPLRTQHLTVPASEQFSLPARAVRAAAALLDVTRFQPDDDRTQPGTRNPEALAAFQQAEALMKKPNNQGLEQAITQYLAALDADSRYAQANARLAIAYLRQYSAHHDPGYIKLAASNADRAIALDSGSIESLLARGSVFLTQGLSDQANRDWEKALSIDPQDPTALLYQAQTYSKYNKWQQADMGYQRLMWLRPNLWNVYSEWGFNLNQQGKFYDALIQFQAAAAKAPQIALVQNNLAYVLYQVGRYGEALKATDRCLAADPNYAPGMQTRADVLRAQGNVRSALQAALASVKADDSDPTNWAEVGVEYELTHRAKDALKAFQLAAETQSQLLEVNPFDGPSWMLLALYRIKAGQKDDATPLIQKAEALGAVDIFSRLAKTQIFELLGKRSEALNALRQAAIMAPIKYIAESTPDLNALREDPNYRTLLKLNAGHA